jgi:hypothetical protein
MKFVLLSVAVLCVAAVLPADDAATIAAQKPLYPLTTCPVSGEKLDDKRVMAVVGSKLVELCCGDCKKDLLADPAKFTAKVDQAYMDRQAKDYPLTTCPVSGEPLGDKPTKLLYGTTLVEFCCKDCIKDFNADPKPSLAKLEAARTGKPAAPAKEEKPMAPGGEHSGH